MPFTLAHPAVVLPIRHRYTHKSALILGAMSPDFVYFLYGKASLGIGHTFLGMLLVNLPLCVVFFYIYCKLAPSLWFFVPKRLNLGHTPSLPNSTKAWLIFLTSAILGMITHVVLDNFTHATGWAVRHLIFLQSPVLGLPLFKWLQHLGGVIGCLIVLLYWLKQAQHTNQQQTAKTKQKWQFWLMVAAFAMTLITIWQLTQPISLTAYATWVIRLVDVFLVALGLFCGLSYCHFHFLIKR